MTFFPKISVKKSLLISHWILTVFLAVVIGLFSTFWFQREEENKFDNQLLSDARGIRSSIEAFYLGDMKNGIINASDLPDYLKQFIRIRLNHPTPYKTTLIVFDSEKKIIGQSNNALNLIGELKKLKDSDNDGSDLKIYSYLKSSPPFKMVTAPLYFQERKFGSICLGIPTLSINVAYSSFLSTLFFILGPITLLFGLLGTWIIHQILKTVKAMTVTVGHISEDSLNSRVEVPAGQDEIHYLAVTFNELLNRLEQDFQFQENLVSQLSHQLRTSLTVLRGRNENALNNIGYSHPARAILEDNLADVDSMNALLNTMLTLARLESHMVKVNLTKINLIPLMLSIIEELNPLWEEKRINIQWTFPWPDNDKIAAFPIFVRIDSFYFKQAIINILNNAYKYSPENKSIEIEIASRLLDGEKFWSLVISNEGPPIPINALEFIFKRFYRVEEQNPSQIHEEVQSGFGLGLSITKTLIELQKGKIRAFNPVYGGAAFEILLPICKH